MQVDALDSLVRSIRSSHGNMSLSALVVAATSEVLILPDRRLIAEFLSAVSCLPLTGLDSVYKALKRRIAVRNPKVQLLTFLLIHEGIQAESEGILRWVASDDFRTMVSRVILARDTEETVKTALLRGVSIWKKLTKTQESAHEMLVKLETELRIGGISMEIENSQSFLSISSTRRLDFRMEIIKNELKIIRSAINTANKFLHVNASVDEDQVRVFIESFQVHRAKLTELIDKLLEREEFEGLEVSFHLKSAMKDTIQRFQQSDRGETYEEVPLFAFLVRKSEVSSENRQEKTGKSIDSSQVRQTQPLFFPQKTVLPRKSSGILQ